MSFLQDLRFAFRSLRRSPGFSVAAIAMLALGIGVNTAIFSVVNSIILRPLPYRDAGRLAFVWTSDPAVGFLERASGFRTIQDWREQARGVEEFAWFREEPAIWNGEPEPEALDAGFASSNLFRQLGVTPVIGRDFTQEESDRGDRLVLISYDLWQRRFGGASDAIGKTVPIDGKPATLIGVLPAGFRPPWNRDVRLWMPDSSAAFFHEMRDSRAVKYGWNVIARLRTGSSPAAAQAELARLSTAGCALCPRSNRWSAPCASRWVSCWSRSSPFS